MGRRSLRLTIVLGALITVVGSTGIFAVFTDRATGGQNMVDSGARPRAADIKIEVGQLDPTQAGGIDCDPDDDGIIGEQDNLLTPQFVAGNLQPGASLGLAYVCISNAGAAPVSLAVSSIDLADIDVSCTGDEAATGDASCGAGAAGELAALLSTEVDRVDCQNAPLLLTDGPVLPLVGFSADLSPGGVNLLAPGGVACLRIGLTYPNPGSETQVQIAQSDQVTWRYAFDAQAT